MTDIISNPRILDLCQPYLVATPWNRVHFDLAPFGVEIPESNIIDPLRLASESFLVLLEHLDALTFGPEGMPMPRWVFYNGSELPGGIMGWAVRPDQLDARQREMMQLEEGYDGPVPVSMYIAIPMVPRTDWMGHNLASLNGVFPELGLRKLGSVTKAIALRVYRTQRLFGATQWDSPALGIHTKFGPLDLITAYTPAHSDPMTLTYRVSITDAGLGEAMGTPNVRVVRPSPDFWLNAKDQQAVEALQDEIEAGNLYRITGKPRREPGCIEIPVKRMGVLV